MKFQELIKYLPPLGLIVAGILMKVSNSKEVFGKMDKYWFYFVILGVVLIILKSI